MYEIQVDAWMIYPCGSASEDAFHRTFTVKSLGIVGEIHFLTVARIYPTIGKARPNLKYLTNSCIGAKSERLPAHGS